MADTIPRKRCKLAANPSGVAPAANVVVATGRVKRGQLAMLPSLPLDILYEIFHFLLPGDLLALTRTSRAFRRLLMTRSVAFIWRAARQNVEGLPEPHSDMNEVQYAALVFGADCDYEGCDKKARDTIWHLRIRSCAGCRPKHKPIKVNKNDDCFIVRAILNCYPDVLERYLPRGPFLSCKGNPIQGFHEAHMKAFKEDLRALPVGERDAYLERRQQEAKVTNEFAAAGVEWQLKTKKERDGALRGRKAARAELIRDMLVEAGFSDEIEYFGWERISKHPLIKSSQVLTEKARPNVLEQLQEYMSDWRELRFEERVHAGRRSLLVDHWLQFSSIAFFDSPGGSPYLPLPPSATIGFSEHIDLIIRQAGDISPDLLRDQLYAAFLPVCDYIIQWHKDVRRELAGLLPGYNPGDDDKTNHAKLNLATSIFRCTAGNECQLEGRALTYPEILYHPCFTGPGLCARPSPKDPRGLANYKAYLAMGGRPWSCKGRVQLHHRQDVAVKILLSCRKDPGITTMSEMDTDDPRLMCTKCAADDGLMAFMSWRRAVQHNIKFHPQPTTDRQWFMAGPHVRARVSQFEIPNLQPLPNERGEFPTFNHSICLSCPPRIPSWYTRNGFGELSKHISTTHGIVCPMFGRDYAFDTNVLPVYPFPVLISSPQGIKKAF
ncbi:hypothetical protein HYDPIDRAFT_23921 [Hydnomerulius pinastri MD-312]|nr:hypothetical protein HYDPIDRAFT_23921 [Hydnomerulius pinastri MD-312]